jgi:phage terminase large subunit-like protein
MPAAATGPLARAGGAQLGERKAALDTRVDRSLPPWRSWRSRSRAARCIRFIETYCRIPSGVGSGQPMRLHRYQRDAIEAVLDSGVRTGGVQIPRGNAKSTLWAAVGLWAICDFPDAPQVPLVAHDSLHAQRTLFRPVQRMVRLETELSRRLVVYTSNAERRVWSPWNDGELLPLPADADRLQGLNPTIALVDEAQTIPPEVWQAVLQGAGKRAESLVLAIGTPAPGAQDSALFDLRERALGGASVAWLEYAAEAGCDHRDRTQWHRANPGIKAGLLFADVLEAELTTVPEAEFRMYRLGQWLEVSVSSWLPLGTVESLPRIEVPVDDTPVILGLAGTWQSSIALVGCTLDGGLFLAWSAETATDDDLEQVLSAAYERWQILELVIAPRTRSNLARRLEDAGMPVYGWPHRTDIEVSSATEFRRALVDGQIAIDHHPVLTEHIANLVGRPTSDGQLQLAAPDDGQPIDAARAARMAWWRATSEAEHPAPAVW